MYPLSVNPLKKLKIYRFPKMKVFLANLFSVDMLEAIVSVEATKTIPV